jgi:hypothetical protein
MAMFGPRGFLGSGCSYSFILLVVDAVFCWTVAAAITAAKPDTYTE